MLKRRSKQSLKTQEKDGMSREGNKKCPALLETSSWQHFEENGKRGTRQRKTSGLLLKWE